MPPSPRLLRTFTVQHSWRREECSPFTFLYQFEPVVWMFITISGIERYSGIQLYGNLYNQYEHCRWDCTGKTRHSTMPQSPPTKKHLARDLWVFLLLTFFHMMIVGAWFISEHVLCSFSSCWPWNRVWCLGFLQRSFCTIWPASGMAITALS